jgi:hypothetical protein
VDEITLDELKVGRTLYVLQSRYANSGTWYDEGVSYFEDDMDEKFNDEYEYRGHDTYFRIIEVTVKRLH